jgi:hypothetical protein
MRSRTSAQTDGARAAGVPARRGLVVAAALVLLGAVPAAWLILWPDLLGGTTSILEPAATVTAIPIPTATVRSADAAPSATPPAVEPLSLVRERQGWQLDVHDGSVRFGAGGGPTPWVGSSRLLLEWFSRPRLGQHKTYLLDIASGRLEPLPGTDVGGGIFPAGDGRSAVLVGSPGPAARVRFWRRNSMPAETVYDTNPAVAQWAGPAAHVWDMGGANLFVAVTRIRPDSFVLALTPDPFKSATIPDWGTKLLLIDTTRRHVRVLTSRGELTGVFPDGTVLWQEGWVDGSLRLLAPPYDGQPVEVVPGGTWTRDWTISPDGQRVAWLEIVPPPGDWSRRLPSGCCGGPDPDPAVRAIGVWERDSGQVRHLPVTGVNWSLSKDNILHWPGLHWRRDSSALLYAGHSQRNPRGTALYQLALDGQAVALADYDWQGTLGVIGEGDDRSLYYYVSGRGYEGNAEIIRRSDDGTQQVLHKGGMMEWVGAQGKLEILERDQLVLWDIATGEAHLAAFPLDELDSGQLGFGKVDRLVPVSPNGRWAAYAGSNSDAVPVNADGTPTDRGRRVRIVPFGDAVRPLATSSLSPRP